MNNKSKRRVIHAAILTVFILAAVPCSVQAQKVVAVSGGGAHALALMDDGTVYSWGSNNGKVLIDHVTMVSAGGSASLALKSDGTVWAWGSSDGSLNSSNTPVQVKGLTNVTAITVGDGACYALKDDGTVWAWGRNKYGQLGDGTTENRPEPVQVKELSNIIALGAGGNYAVKDDGTVWAWGSNDLEEGSYGALGDSSGPGLRLIPFQVKGVSNVTQISNGGNHAIYVKDDGTVWGWGCYDLGQLGDGSTHSSRPPPVKYPSVRTQIDNVKKVSCGGAYTIALKDDGTVWQWGQLIGNPEPRPFRVNGLDHIVDISACGTVCIVLKDDGTVWTWGCDDMDCGLLGNDDTRIRSTNPAFNYVVKRNPVLVFSGLAQPTASTTPDGTSGTDVPGVSTPGMGFDSTLLAGLTVMVICSTAKRCKRIR